jgi:hypothetical protein
MPLIESAPFNIGKGKKYLGAPCNLVAYGCKLSKEYGFDGVVAFDAKTKKLTLNCFLTVSKTENFLWPIFEYDNA